MLLPFNCLTLCNIKVEFLVCIIFSYTPYNAFPQYIKDVYDYFGGTLEYPHWRVEVLNVVEKHYIIDN